MLAEGYELEWRECPDKQLAEVLDNGMELPFSDVLAMVREECSSDDRKVRLAMVLLLQRHLNTRKLNLDQWLDDKEEKPAQSPEEASPAAGAEALVNTFFAEKQSALVFRGHVLPATFAVMRGRGQLMLADAAAAVVAMSEEVRRQVRVVDAYGSNLSTSEDVQ